MHFSPNKPWKVQFILQIWCLMKRLKNDSMIYLGLCATFYMCISFQSWVDYLQTVIITDYKLHD